MNVANILTTSVINGASRIVTATVGSSVDGHVLTNDDDDESDEDDMDTSETEDRTTVSNGGSITNGSCINGSTEHRSGGTCDLEDMGMYV